MRLIDMTAACQRGAVAIAMIVMAFSNHVGAVTPQLAATSSAAAGFALAGDGTLYAWGDDFSGRLASGRVLSRGAAGPVSAEGQFIKVFSGNAHSLALRSDGSLWAWGANSAGQLGDGSTASKSTPVLVGTGYVSVAAGLSHTIALKSDGSLWAWGDNTSGRTRGW